MSNLIRIIIKKDESEAGVAAEKLRFKEFDVSIFDGSEVVLDYLDFEDEKYELLSNTDKKVYVIVGRK